MLTRANIDSFVAHLHMNGASVHTVRAYETDLRLAMIWVAEQRGDETPTWEELETLLARYLTANRATWAPKTTTRRMGTYRVWGKWNGRKDFLAAYRPPTPAKQVPKPIAEGIPGVLAMVASTRNHRHKALCVLTGLMGLRVDEAVNVRPEHFDLHDMTLTVRGKGDKTRVVPVSDNTFGLLSRRIAEATLAGETLVGLTNQGARAAISRHARKAGLSRHVASHMMRATFATAAWENTHDLRAVQELLGHADSKTTQLYTLVSPAAMRAAATVH